MKKKTGVAPSPRAAPGLHGVLLTVGYDGRLFHGFAPQPGQRTVGGELLGALQMFDPRVLEVRAASRTDSGVHATGQRIAFDTTAALPTRGWVLAANRHLPGEIAVRRAAFVAPAFVPRFASTGKRYRYLIVRDRVRDPFFYGRAYRIEGLDEEAIARARLEAQAALGTHDFAAFRSSADERLMTTRTLTSIDVEVDPRDPRLVSIVVEGTAFLHNMVRILVGTLISVGLGRLAPGAIERALASRNRRDAGPTAPPDGLCLEEVYLNDRGHGAWPPDADDVSRPDLDRPEEAPPSDPPG